MKKIINSFLLLSFCNLLFASKEDQPILGKYINQAELAAKLPVTLTKTSLNNENDYQEMLKGTVITFNGILPDAAQVHVRFSVKLGPWAMIISNKGQSQRLKDFEAQAFYIALANQALYKIDTQKPRDEKTGQKKDKENENEV